MMELSNNERIAMRLVQGGAIGLKDLPDDLGDLKIIENLLHYYLTNARKSADQLGAHIHAAKLRQQANI